jgi:hypothetical protein
VKSIVDVTKVNNDLANNIMAALAPIQNRLGAINAQPNNDAKAEQMEMLAKMKLNTILRILTKEQMVQLGGEPRLVSILTSK